MRRIVCPGPVAQRAFLLERRVFSLSGCTLGGICYVHVVCVVEGEVLNHYLGKFNHHSEGYFEDVTGLPAV